MEIFFYIIIFIMGITFGSFYTLAVYRIPKKQDITHTHSYCPNCNHKLNIFDLIPVFSYIFLGGKCRYCKNKIRPRYLIIEIISGLFFVLIAYFMGLNIENLSFINIADFSFFVLYFSFVIIMAGIDKEYRVINKPVLMYGIVVSIMYMIYLYIVESANIYRYVMYLVLFVLLLWIDTLALKKGSLKNSYTISILLVIVIMEIFTGEFVTLCSAIMTFITILCISILQSKRKKSGKIIKGFDKGFRIGLILAVFDVIYFLLFLMGCIYV